MKYRKEILTALLQARVYINTDPDLWEDHGICDITLTVLRNQDNCGNENFSSVRHEWRNSCVSLFPRWPEYSGATGYPVPDPDGKCPIAKFCNTGNLWEDTEYGQARRRLLDWMIKMYQEMDDSEEG